MKHFFFFFTLLLALSACNKNGVIGGQEQFPENVDIQHLISTEHAIGHVKMIVGTLNDVALTKSGSFEYETKVITKYLNVNFTNFSKSEASYRDSVRVPLYLIGLADKKSAQKSTVLFIGDDRLNNPFVAFSKNKKFNPFEIPGFEGFFVNNLKSYIQDELEQATFLSRNITPPPGYRYCYAASNYRLEVENVKGPLINVSWDHWASPMNDSTGLCTTTGLPAKAGCVAVATTHLLSFYKYPTSGFYKHPRFARPVTTTYNWNLMTSVYDPTQTQNTTIRTMIANIHAEVGYRLPVSYNCNGSSAFFEDISACLGLLGYSYGGTYVSNISLYPAILRNEVDANRPVLMFGIDSQNAGHAWALDGYKIISIEKGIIYYCFRDGNYGPIHDLEIYEPEDNREVNIYYHCRLGWGPSNDGYFLTTTVTGSRGTYNATKALIGVQK